MSRFVDIRVAGEDLPRAQTAILAAFAPVDLQIDCHPPASGPEAQISIADRPERAVLALMRLHGISVLASRTRVAASMARQLGQEPDAA